jgi:flavin reductase (DIM6/NTAB) family NADH-FMN oxidoreductase RutF
MLESAPEELVSLELNLPIWSRFFSVAPLIAVGTREADGNYDLAPKHMAMPLGWGNYFGFVCTPRHRTYQNIRREQAFTVSFPRPDRVILTSLAAAPRCEDDSKPTLAVLPTFPASVIDSIFLKDAYLFLECKLDRIVDGFGENSLIAGQIVAAYVQPQALRVSDGDDRDLLVQEPLLAYLPPGRYAKIEYSFSFPFHQGFQQ